MKEAFGHPLVSKGHIPAIDHAELTCVITSFLDSPHRLLEGWLLKLARDIQGNGQVEGANENAIDPL